MTDEPPGTGPGEDAAAPDSFRIEERTAGGATVVALYGEVDLAAAPAVRERLSALSQQSPDRTATARVLVIDLAGVTFIDSTGLSMLVAAHARLAEARNELRIAAVPQRVSRVLELTGLDGLLATYPDVPSALAGAAGA